jgi:hypothetical protein
MAGSCQTEPTAEGRSGDSMLDGIFPADNVDYLGGSPLARTCYVASFFEQVDYIGAFRSEASARIWNWTDFPGL